MRGSVEYCIFGNFFWFPRKCMMSFLVERNRNEEINSVESISNS